VASPSAIAATTAAIKTLLDRAAAASPDFANVTVSTFRTDDLQSPPSSETALVVSIYLYRVTLSSVRLGMPAVVDHDGRRVRAPILLDLHYVVTAWARSALMQQKLLGWAVRALEDNPVLPATLLNDGGWEGTFGQTETVELVWQPIAPQEEWDLWQVAQTSQQPSAIYLARGVALESLLPVVEEPPVQTVELDYSQAEATA
jgi:hypothetical protein